MADRADLGVPEGSLDIEVDGVRLAVAREGHGPAVVCLHATGHGGRDFEAFTEAMKARFEVIRIDWPGQGRSGDDPRHPASAARYADLLTAALPLLGVERPIIVGNSIGGAAAMIHAARAPVRALVLCDPGGLVAMDKTARAFCGAFVQFFAAGVRGAWWFKPAFALYYRLVLPAPAAAAQRRRIVACGRQIAPVLVQSWTSFGRPDADIRDIAVNLKVPVWFAWAKSDRVIPLSRCLPTIRAMRDASVSTYSGGHAAFLEQPGAFARDFAAFVDRLGAARATKSPAPGGEWRGAPVEQLS